jgi:hypothetical protein
MTTPERNLTWISGEIAYAEWDHDSRLARIGVGLGRSKTKRVTLTETMRIALVALLLVCVPFVSHAQASSPAGVNLEAQSLPKAPAAILAAAAPFYDYSSAALKPWHLKASYQLYDDSGKPSAQGTYEYWWASPGNYRSTWKRPGLEHTDWHVSGQHYSLGTGEPLLFSERKLQSDLLTPLPNAGDLDPGKVRFEKQEQQFGKVKLPCVVVIKKMPLHGQLQIIPSGLFPTFCFEPEKPIMRAYYAFGATSVIYNKVVRAQGLYLARDIAIFEGTTKYLTASIDVIDGLSPSAAELTPDKDAQSESSPKRVPISSGMATGMLVKQTRPIYPQDAKSAHIDGKVVLQAIIGVDGRVHDLTAVDGPSPSLIAASMVAVSQWRYKPYLLNGAPVEVDTTVNVIYRLGNN